MTTLSKEDVVRVDNDLLAMIQKHFPSLPLDDRYTDWGKWLGFAKAVYSHGEQAARADLVAENERLKEMAMFFSTYTDPDELEMDEIENAARESFSRANSGVRGTTITRANGYESHVIWATKARISKELTATRTKLAAAEADNERLRKVVTANHEWHKLYDIYEGYVESDLASMNSRAIAESEARSLRMTLLDQFALAAAEARETKLRDELEFIRQLPSAEQYRINGIAHQALAQPRDDSALRRLLAEAKAGVYEECAKVCENSDRYRGDYFAAKIRELAEKAKA